VVQALLSLQGAVLLANTQPDPGLQLSSVQLLPSLHESAGPPAQAPPAQVSDVVQALPSLHGAVLLVFTQLPVPLQTSSVQTLPSEVQAVPAATAQLSASSLQELLQTPPVVHGSPAWTAQAPPEQVSAPLQ
jgi:hypothetical protein